MVPRGLPGAPHGEGLLARRYRTEPFPNTAKNIIVDVVYLSLGLQNMLSSSASLTSQQTGVLVMHGAVPANRQWVGVFCLKDGNIV
jgi:hypothetical protein